MCILMYKCICVYMYVSVAVCVPVGIYVCVCKCKCVYVCSMYVYIIRWYGTSVDEYMYTNSFLFYYSQSLCITLSLCIPLFLYSSLSLLLKICAFRYLYVMYIYCGSQKGKDLLVDSIGYMLSRYVVIYRGWHVTTESSYDVCYYRIMHVCI